MANTKVSALTAISTPASGDELYINDISDTTDSADGSSRKITYTNLVPVTETSTNTLTNKTLTTPTIGSFTNATHTHQNNAGGGTLDHGAALTGLTDDDHTIYLKVDGTRAMTGDLNLATSGNVQVNSADPKRTMYVPASAMYPSTTAPCASITQVESSTNDVNIKVLDFDGAGSSKEYAEFGIQSPTYWDASTVTAQFIWYATAGSGTVNWEIQGLALSDDDALDAAYGTLQEVTDTLLATGDVHITAETSAITIAGSPVAGDWLQFKVARDPANDTNTSDARLMGVRIRFGVKQYNDA